MKALFNCHHQNMAWFEQFFPGENPYLCPILNKPLIEYWLDFCALSLIDEILILDSEYDARIAEFVGDGSKWNLKISYYGDNISSECNTNLTQHYKSFFQDSDFILIFNGLFFQHYDQRSMPDLHVMAAPPWYPEIAGDGLLVSLPPDHGISRMDTRITQLTGIDSYYCLNMFILKEECENYVIPGYKIENGIYTGMNDEIPPSCEIAAPAVLGDNVSLGEKCVLSGAVIIGPRVVIDKRSTLAESLVMGNTYIGADLEFIGKIVYRNSVIDPSNDTKVDILDLELTGEVRSFSSYYCFSHVIAWFTTLFFVILFALPFLFFLLIGVLPHGKKRFYVQKKKHLLLSLAAPDFTKNLKTLRGRIFHFLSLNKYCLLFYVLIGRMNLVGNHPYSVDDPAAEEFLMRNYPEYKAGVFSLSEMTNSNSNPMYLLDDRFLTYNRSLRLEMQIIFRSLIGKAFMSYAE